MITIYDNNDLSFQPILQIKHHEGIKYIDILFKFLLLQKCRLLNINLYKQDMSKNEYIENYFDNIQSEIHFYETVICDVKSERQDISKYIHYAAINNIEELFYYIIEYNLTNILDNEDNKGNTVLHYLILNNNIDLIKKLIAYVSVDIPNNEGITAYKLCGDNKEILNILAPINSPNDCDIIDLCKFDEMTYDERTNLIKIGVNYYKPETLYYQFITCKENNKDFIDPYRQKISNSKIKEMIEKANVSSIKDEIIYDIYGKLDFDGFRLYESYKGQKKDGETVITYSYYIIKGKFRKLICEMKNDISVRSLFKENWKKIIMLTGYVFKPTCNNDIINVLRIYK